MFELHLNGSLIENENQNAKIFKCEIKWKTFFLLHFSFHRGVEFEFIVKKASSVICERISESLLHLEAEIV